MTTIDMIILTLLSTTIAGFLAVIVIAASDWIRTVKFEKSFLREKEKKKKTAMKQKK